MSDTSCCKRSFPIALIVGVIAIVASAYALHTGLTHFRSADRFVTVKGLATQDVEADLAIWSLTHTVTGDDLAAVQANLESDGNKVRSFLLENGIKEDAIRLQGVQVTDLMAQTYRSGEISGARYIIAQTFIVRTNELDAIGKASENLGALVRQGVVLGNPNGGYNAAPQYIFTKLNDVKPTLLADASKNAREAANQFANDAGLRVGDIKNASQGVIEIQPRDPVMGISEGEQRYKTVRVVVTLQYTLK